MGIEKVAYELNLLLGLDLVPPVAYRRSGLRFCTVDGGAKECFEEGSVQLYVEGTCPLREHPPERWGVRRDVLLSDTRVLDTLCSNSDRHHGGWVGGWMGGWVGGWVGGGLCAGWPAPTSPAAPPRRRRRPLFVGAPLVRGARVPRPRLGRRLPPHPDRPRRRVSPRGACSVGAEGHHTTSASASAPDALAPPLPTPGRGAIGARERVWHRPRALRLCLDLPSPAPAGRRLGGG